MMVTFKKSGYFSAAVAVNAGPAALTGRDVLMAPVLSDGGADAAIIAS